VIDAVEEIGELDNTLIIFIQGDNGASAEGSLQGLSNEVGVVGNSVPESLEYLVAQYGFQGGDKGPSRQGRSRGVWSVCQRAPSARLAP